MAAIGSSELAAASPPPKPQNLAKGLHHLLLFRSGLPPSSIRQRAARIVAVFLPRPPSAINGRSSSMLNRRNAAAVRRLLCPCRRPMPTRALGGCLTPKPCQAHPSRRVHSEVRTPANPARRSALPRVAAAGRPPRRARALAPWPGAPAGPVGPTALARLGRHWPFGLLGRRLVGQLRGPIPGSGEPPCRSGAQRNPVATIVLRSYWPLRRTCQATNCGGRRVGKATSRRLTREGWSWRGMKIVPEGLYGQADVEDVRVHGVPTLRKSR